LKSSGIIRNTAALQVIQIANQLLPLVTIPHLTRALGVDSYGAYAYALALTTIACIVTDFGFNLWATAEVSQNRNDRQLVNRLFGAVMGAKLLLLVLSLMTIWTYATFSGVLPEHRSVLYWAALPIIGITLQPIWLFNGLEQMTYITVFVLVARLVFIALVVTQVDSATDLDLLMGINGLSQVIAALLACAILIRHGYRPVRPSLTACRRVLKSSSPFFLSRVAVSTYTAGGALFLGMVSSMNSVALYAVAEQLYRGAQALLSPLGQVMYPYMVRTRNFGVLMKATAVATLAACAGSALTIMLGVEIIRLLFGAEYAAALPVLQIFFITIIINTPSILLGYPMLGALGQLHLANRSVLVAGVLQIVVLCAWYLLGRTSPVDVALAVLMAELAVLTLRATWGAQGWRRQQRAQNQGTPVA
jgi:PST family polysaccharide transporter